MKKSHREDGECGVLVRLTERKWAGWCWKEEKWLSDLWSLENGENPHPPAHREGALNLDELSLFLCLTALTQKVGHRLRRRLGSCSASFALPH